MHFLEPPRVLRTPSTEEFVVEEDKASDLETNSSRRESLSTGSYRYSKIFEFYSCYANFNGGMIQLNNFCGFVQ